LKLLKVANAGDDKLKKFIDTLKGYHMTVETRKMDGGKAYIRVYEHDVNRILQVARRSSVSVLEA